MAVAAASAAMIHEQSAGRNLKYTRVYWRLVIELESFSVEQSETARVRERRAIVIGMAYCGARDCAVALSTGRDGGLTLLLLLLLPLRCKKLIDNFIRTS